MMKIVLVLCLLLFVETAADVSCKDPNGNAVDWFIALKLPIMTKSADPISKAGLRFYYLDVNNPAWKLSAIPINDGAGHPVASTINQVYNDKKILHLLYNDKTPSGKQNPKYGHTKGVVAFGESTGFWMVHSVPAFPGTHSYSYPVEGQRYGQSFLCMTLGTKENMEKIAEQLLITYPQLYSYNVPTSFFTDKLLSLINGKRKITDQGSLKELKSTGGQTFVSFAKTDTYGEDLYTAWLPTYVKSTVLVETYMRGANPLPSECKGAFKVKNVRIVSFGGENIFKNTQDHSKWAVADNTPWSCVGGINRMESQKKRGGGIVCFKNETVAKSFKGIVSKADVCPKRAYYAPQMFEFL